jgi:hypothetical protein
MTSIQSFLEIYEYYYFFELFFVYFILVTTPPANELDLPILRERASFKAQSATYSTEAS